MAGQHTLSPFTPGELRDLGEILKRDPELNQKQLAEKMSLPYSTFRMRLAVSGYTVQRICRQELVPIRTVPMETAP